MNTYVEITDGTTNNYFYAFVEFKGSVLTLYSFQGLNRNIVKEIPMNEIENLTKDIYIGAGSGSVFRMKEKCISFLNAVQLW